MSTKDLQDKQRDIIKRLRDNHAKTIKALDNVLKEEPKWSDKALGNYPDIHMFCTQKDDIAYWLGMALAGIPLARQPEKFPLPDIRTPPNIKKYIADIYEVEPSDIDILLSGDYK